MHYIQLVSVCAPCVKHTLCCRLNETGKLDNRFTLHSQLLNISLQSHMMPWWGQNELQHSHSHTNIGLVILLIQVFINSCFMSLYH